MKRRSEDHDGHDGMVETDALPDSQTRRVAAYNTDTKISEALYNLSVQDRNAIEEEIHGVSCMALDETPELLRESLAKFHAELKKIDSKPAYERSLALLAAKNRANTTSQQQSLYIHEEAFKLRFLRADFFDARKAAQRYTKYLDFVTELHGEICLRRPIQMSDLDRNSFSFLRDGQYQVLPYRDRSGRRIVCMVSNSRKHFSKPALHKVCLYLWMSIIGGFDVTNNDLDYLETQRKGAIVVVMTSFQRLYSDITFEESLRFAKIRIEANKLIGSIVPLRLCGAHICFPDNPLAKAMTGLFSMVMSRWAPRMKFHFGNPLELRYKLQGYGIPTELIPSTDTGNVKSGNLKQWIKLRKFLDEQARQHRKTMTYYSESDGSDIDYDSTASSSSMNTLSQMNNIVECPGSKDVIFRRGRSMHYHPGNVQFQNLIQSHIYEHTIDPNTTQARRLAIEKDLIQQVLEGGGRFLKWEIDKGWWVDMAVSTEPEASRNRNTGSTGVYELDNKEILSKVHYAFRDFRKKMIKPQQPLITTTSATYAFERQDGQKRKRYTTDGAGGNECNLGDGCTSIFSKPF